MEGARKFLVDKITGVANLGGVPHPQPQPHEESIVEFLLEKLHQLLHIFDNFWAFLVDKLDQILPPPETLHRWIHVGLTWALPVALLLLLLCCCCCNAGPLLAFLVRCCLLPFRLLGQLLASLGRCCLFPFRLLGRLLAHLGRYCCCCCRKSCRGLHKMMKAPGRGGVRMPRASFAGNPRGYFLDLRANKPLVY